VKHPSVIVIRKPRAVRRIRHRSGAWKVAYADFVTAVMAFFLVMWLVTQGQGIRQAVAGYFKDPAGFDDQRMSSLAARGNVLPDTAGMPHLREADPGPVVVVKDEETLEKTAGRLKNLLSQMPDFKRLGKQIEIQMTPEGLRIELMDAGDSTFFDTGSAAPKPETERILATIASELGQLKNDVVVEGHTDSRPYANSLGYSNWELSTDRANAARRVMERAGLSPRRIKGVRGFADTRLRTEADAFDSHNRRVSIVVQNSHGGVGDPGGSVAGLPTPRGG
jgi:chemotaxis protein MotB